MTIETATAYQYAYDLGLFHCRDASFSHHGATVHITARHRKDESTKKYFENGLDDMILVSVRTITNGKLGKGRALADDQRKVMLNPSDILTLVPTA